MNSFKRFSLVALVFVIISCMAFQTAFSEETLQPKTTIRIYVSKSSSQELIDTGTANMKIGESLTFEISNEKDSGGYNKIAALYEDDDFTKVSMDSSGTWTVKARQGGTSTITFVNILKANPLKLGEAKLVLTFNVLYDDVESVALNTESLKLIKGKTYKLSATVLPATANKKLTWTSSDLNVASVSANGKITGVNPGVAVITCRTVDENIFATCEVEVNPKYPNPESIDLSESEIHLLKGKSKKITKTILPSNANKNVTWTTSDPTVAKVTSDGVVKAKNPGTATITCTTNQMGLKASCEVVVFAQYATPESLTLTKSSISLVKGKTQKLIASILPADANKNVTWSSSNKNVAKVNSNGLVTAVKPGTATITCKSKQGGLTAACEVEVTPKA